MGSSGCGAHAQPVEQRRILSAIEAEILGRGPQRQHLHAEPFGPAPGATAFLTSVSSFTTQG